MVLVTPKLMSGPLQYNSVYLFKMYNDYVATLILEDICSNES